MPGLKLIPVSKRPIVSVNEFDNKIIPSKKIQNLTVCLLIAFDIWTPFY